MRRRSAQGTLSVWAAVAGLWLVVIVAWATQMGLDRWVVDARQSDAVAEYYRSREPEIGTIVSLPPEDINGQPISREDSETEDVLLIIAGSCSECAKNKFDPARLDLSSFSQVILVFTSSVEQIRAAQLELPGHARVLADTRGELAMHLNAHYQPRFYLLDRGLRLRKLQGDVRGTSNWYMDLLTKGPETSK